MSAKGFSNPTGLKGLLPARIIRLAGLLLGLCLLAAVVLYGVGIYLENRILKSAHDTRTLQEDNQELQIRLDKIRSYQNVADASSRIQGLKVATEVIDVLQKPQAPQQAKPQAAEKPLSIPRSSYGY